jgi:AcrR family transcriptional regulator
MPRTTKKASADGVPDVRKEAIYTVARNLFCKRGFAETSMQDIASELGLQRGSLYHHIESKEELLLDILESSLNEMFEAVERILNSRNSASEKLRLYLMVSLETMARRQQEMLIWISEIRRMPEVLAPLVNRVKRADSNLMRIIEEGIETGEWTPKDKELAFQTIRGVIAWFPHWYKSSGRLSVSEISQEMSRWAIGMLTS